VGAAIRGTTGHIKWGYYAAAAIRGYVITRKGGVWRVQATVVHCDAFKLKQKPLIFVADYKTKKGEPRDWRWPIDEMNLERGVLTAKLGAPIEERAYGALPIRSA
jgi:hypothetical protein